MEERIRRVGLGGGLLCKESADKDIYPALNDADELLARIKQPV